MQKILYTLFILIIISACKHQTGADVRKDFITFKGHFDPSFDESASFVLSKINSNLQIKFLIMGDQRRNKAKDTFYCKTVSLTKNQFDEFDKKVVQRTKIKQPKQWTGCCDGMPVSFQLIQNSDTSEIYFRNPDIKSDTIGYRITKLTVDNLKSLLNDTIINDYLDDIESYMDTVKKHSNWRDNRAITKLRKLEYSN
jgi:hypothetical protein